MQRLALLMAALFVVSCSQQTVKEEMTDGRIVYSPKEDSDIRPSIETSSLISAYVIVDRVTGYHLHQKRSVSIPALSDRILTLWMLDRSSQEEPPVFFLTKRWEDKESFFPRMPGIEIIHAYQDEFFPFDHPLSPPEFSFDRVVLMLDRQGQKEKPKFLRYLDNRVAYVQKTATARAMREREQFFRANFDFDPLIESVSEVYAPIIGTERFDQKRGLSGAEDGTTLRLDHGQWSGFPDRSGRPAMLRAEWNNGAGTNPWSVTLTALRSFREGYGETRAFEVSSLSRPTFRGEPIEVESQGPPPNSKTLAALINVSNDFGGAHVGKLVILINGEIANLTYASD